MFIVPVRAKRGKKTSDSGMAGAAKAPASAATASKEELKLMAAQMGWEIRDAISYEEIQRMSSAELRFREVWNKDALDRAFEVEQNKRLNRERIPLWDIRNKWEGKTLITPEEAEAARKAGATFAERSPRFERTQENALAICGFMAEHDLDPEQVSSYVTAFNALVDAGQMKLAPVQSADEYLAANADTLVDKRVPPIIQARKAKADATEKHFEKARAASAKSGSTTVIDYENEQSGYPAAPTKYSFRRLLDSLSAEEYQRRVNEDPAFRKSVDALNS